VPSEILEVAEKIKEYLPIVNKNIYVIDQNLIFNTLTEIRYYYDRKLINEDELSQMKAELNDVVDISEKMVRSGIFNSNEIKSYFYISSLPIEINSLLLWNENNHKPYFLYIYHIHWNV